MNFTISRQDYDGLRSLVVQHNTDKQKLAIIAVDSAVSFPNANTDWSIAELAMLIELSKNFLVIFNSLPQ